MDYLAEWQEPPVFDTVRCSRVEVPKAASAVLVGYGLRERDGMMVRFRGDRRQMLAVAEAIRERGGPVPCEVPASAVISARRPKADGRRVAVPVSGDGARALTP